MKNSILRDYKQSTEYYQINCFNFDDFILPDHKKEISHSFLEWFVGFVEVKFEFQTRGFEILDNDIQLLHKIRTTLGFGKITVYNQQCWKYSVRKQKWVDQLIHLFNGNFVLKNTLNKFNRWVNKQKKTEKKKKQQCVKFSLKNAWFSGFIQAKAKFNASFSINSKNISSSVYFSISGNQTLCHEIEKLFMITGIFYHYKKKPKQYKIIFINLPAQKQLIDYLFNFPVLGQQYKTFYCWWRIYLYRQERALAKECQRSYVSSLKQQKKLKRLCSQINYGNIG
uniref:Putative site-specific DNA endonuclease n=1 Tax=Stichococcus bacillaris TaxID=37433 RepID=A0A097KKL4_9CHLO|nr:putative site-specific DNA endonuclease [Stichococcus bacillaris]AIT93718.1 putative site-specific DNA endonuclease [Stichococcus bacillaris]|mmetsp:Transcript_20980/g.63148  ORF Transcript_20980/g.63148 Transcript_20980/m.63148 type:complete len:282 (-) Transcript_20980:49-894(-)